ncbi:unnamed protein product, partial [Durusdinium trenchii]
MEIALAQDIMALCLSQTQEMAKQEQKRQQRARRLSDLLALVLRRPQVACELGRFVGLWGAKCLAESSKHHGEHLRGAGLTRLREAALPEIYLCGGQSLRQTTPVLERYVHATGRQEDPPRGSMRRTTATPLAGLAVCQMFEVWRSGPVIWKTIGIQYWQGRKGFLTPSREMLRLCYTSWTPWNSGVLHARREWEVLSPMPTARSFCCAAGLGGKIYVLGGEKDQRAAFAACECFDPQTGDWTRLPPMPTARAGAACAVADQKLVVCGLERNWQVLDVVEAFDPSVRKWRRLPAMPTPRCGCCACGVKGQILVMGGQLADGTVLDKVELLDLQRLVWDRLPAMPSPRSGGGCGLVGPERSGPGAVVYLLGGLGASGLTVPVVDRLDLEEKVWRTPFTTSLARAGCAVVTVGHEIHLLGGFDSNRQDSDRHEVLNTQTGE